MEYAHDPFLFPLVREPASRWERAGLSEKQERSFNRAATLLTGGALELWQHKQRQRDVEVRAGLGAFAVRGRF